MSRQIIRFTVDKPPSVNSAYGTDWKTRRRFKTKDYERWLESAERSLYLTKWMPISGPVVITLTIADEGRADLANHEKLLVDFCVKHKMIEDDKRSIVRQIILRWGRPGSGATVEIEGLEDASVHYTQFSDMARPRGYGSP